MRRERERTDQIKHGHSRAIHVTAAANPNGLFGFCCGPGLPVVDEPPEHGRGHHTACPVWRAEKERIAAAREMVATPKERGATTPFGVPVSDQVPGDESFDPERIVSVANELGASADG